MHTDRFLKSLLAVVAVMLSAVACAGETGPGTQSTVFVDVAEVAESGEVQPVDGITAAGQPDARAFEVFANAGYEAVIDMRGPDEDRGLENEPELVKSLGLEYVAFPITDRKQIDFDTAKALDEMLESYDGPVLIHCASSNRVGALLALRESLRGASDEEALEFGKQAGMTRLEPLVKERLADE